MINNILHFFYRRYSFSQEGEDIILNQILNDKKSGFYIDIGAHHPVRFSNTYLFYLKGWRGLNIEADNSKIKFFNFFRKRDHNINALVSTKNSIEKYYRFKESALNGILDNKRLEELKLKGIDPIEILEIKSQDINSILSKYSGQNIDFISIDIEGKDHEILSHINLENLRPKVILVERSKDLIKNNYFKKHYEKVFSTSRNDFFSHR